MRYCLQQGPTLILKLSENPSPSLLQPPNKTLKDTPKYTTSNNRNIITPILCYHNGFIDPPNRYPRPKLPVNHVHHISSWPHGIISYCLFCHI